MKTDLFQSCGHCWVFQICWHIECNTFTASSFRIWNGSTGIPSPPLALFVVMLSKAHVASHSRMSGSRWMITPLWLSWLWRSFLCSSWAVSKMTEWSLFISKASRGDGIPVELFQILKDAAVKVLRSICQQIWKTQQWPQEKVSFHSNPKERQCQRMLTLPHNCTHLTC